VPSFKPNLNVLDIEDIVFEPHAVQMPWSDAGGVSAVDIFPNGYAASIVGGGVGLYGDGKSTFELAVLKLTNFDDPESLKFDDDNPITRPHAVLGWVRREEMNGLLLRIASLPQLEVTRE
jgi:hypothetical protein